VLPLIGLLGSEALLLLTRLEPWWAGSIRNALRHSVFWHLGFWEWTGAGAIFAFLCAAVFLMPAQANVTVKGLPRQTLRLWPPNHCALSTSINASCGILMRPMLFIRFFPSFCFSRSLRFRVISPP